jgi:hypothetical protein
MESGENVGFGGGCNAGAETAGGSHLVFLNRDAVIAAIDDQWLRLLLATRPFKANVPARTTEAMRGRHTVGTSSASDDLCTGPMVWSLLGWIQYVCTHEGERAASRAARTTFTPLCVLRLGVRVLGAMHWARARRKAWQLDELLRLLSEYASGNHLRFCPDALRMARNHA